jgi:hypothetical protein
VLPAVYCKHLADVVAPWGVTPRILFGSPVDQQLANDQPISMRLGYAIRVVEEARRLTGEPALGILLGLRATPAFFLEWRLAGAGTSKRFVTVDGSNAMSLVFEARQDNTLVQAVERASFGPARDVVLLATLLAAWQATRALVGRHVATSLTFALPKPAYFDRFAHVLPPCRFGHDANTVSIQGQPEDGVTGYEAR